MYTIAGIPIYHDDLDGYSAWTHQRCKMCDKVKMRNQFDYGDTYCHECRRIRKLEELKKK